jgi:hypothetical protein
MEPIVQSTREIRLALLRPELARWLGRGRALAPMVIDWRRPTVSKLSIECRTRDPIESFAVNRLSPRLSLFIHSESIHRTA